MITSCTFCDGVGRIPMLIFFSRFCHACNGTGTIRKEKSERKEAVQKPLIIGNNLSRTTVRTIGRRRKMDQIRQMALQQDSRITERRRKKVEDDPLLMGLLLGSTLPDVHTHRETARSDDPSPPSGKGGAFAGGGASGQWDETPSSHASHRDHSSLSHHDSGQSRYDSSPSDSGGGSDSSGGGDSGGGGGGGD